MNAALGIAFERSSFFRSSFPSLPSFFFCCPWLSVSSFFVLQRLIHLRPFKDRSVPFPLPPRFSRVVPACFFSPPPLRTARPPTSLRPDTFHLDWSLFLLEIDLTLPQKLFSLRTKCLSHLSLSQAPTALRSMSVSELVLQVYLWPECVLTSWSVRL